MMLMDTEESAFEQAVKEGDLRRLKSLENTFPVSFDQVKETLPDLAYRHRRADVLMHLILEKGLRMAPASKAGLVQYDDEMYGKGADQYVKTIECVAHAAFGFSLELESDGLGVPARRNGSCYTMFQITDALREGDTKKAEDLIRKHPVDPAFIRAVEDGHWHRFAEAMLAKRKQFVFGGGTKHFIRVLESAEHVQDLGRKLGDLTGYAAENGKGPGVGEKVR